MPGWPPRSHQLSGTEKSSGACVSIHWGQSPRVGARGEIRLYSQRAAPVSASRCALTSRTFGSKQELKFQNDPRPIGRCPRRSVPGIGLRRDRASLSIQQWGIGGVRRSRVQSSQSACSTGSPLDVSPLYPCLPSLVGEVVLRSDRPSSAHDRHVPVEVRYACCCEH